MIRTGVAAAEEKMMQTNIVAANRLTIDFAARTGLRTTGLLDAYTATATLGSASRASPADEETYRA